MIKKVGKSRIDSWNLRNGIKADRRNELERRRRDKTDKKGHSRIRDRI